MIRPATACQEETKFCNVDSRLHIVGAECTFSPIVVFIIMLSHLKLHAAVGRTKQAPFPTIFPFMCLSQEAPIFHKTITSLSSASNTILVMTPGSRFRSYLDVNHVLPRRPQAHQLAAPGWRMADLAPSSSLPSSSAPKRLL